MHTEILALSNSECDCNWSQDLQNTIWLKWSDWALSHYNCHLSSLGKLGIDIADEDPVKSQKIAMEVRSLKESHYVDMDLEHLTSRNAMQSTCFINHPAHNTLLQKSWRNDRQTLLGKYPQGSKPPLTKNHWTRRHVSYMGSY